MVAPNSPIALAKHRMAPAITPGRQSGRVMVAKTRNGWAPRVRGRRFEPRVDGLDRQADGAHQQRKAHHRTGQRRAGPAEGEDDAELLVEEGADRPALAERDAAAGSPSPPAAGSAAGGPARRAGSCRGTVGAPAARRRRCRTAGWPRSPSWRPAGSAGPPSIRPVSCSGGGLHQNREALLLERRARLGAAQEVEERLGVGVLRLLDERRRIDDRRMRCLRGKWRRS